MSETAKKTLDEKIIDRMLVEIERYKLELLQRYPNDILIYDRNALARSAKGGSKFAWMVGHSHTHLANLGVHKAFNETPTYLTHLASEDRFYVIDVSRNGEDFTMKEVTREYFPSLSHTPIPYRRVGGPEAFWLFNGTARVGTATITRGGTYEKPIYNLKLTTVAGVPEKDKVALEDWAMQATVELAHSLFVRAEIAWEAPMVLEAV